MTSGEYACVVDLVYRDGGTELLRAGRAPGLPVRRRSRDPGPAGRAELPDLDRTRRAAGRDAPGRTHGLEPSELLPSPTGRRRRPRRPLSRRPPRTAITRPLKRNGGPRFLTDVIVELGFADRERVEAAVEAARAGGEHARGGPARAGRAHGRPARPGGRRAPRPRPPRPDASSRSTWRAANLISSAGGQALRGACRSRFADERTLLVAMADPANVLAIDDIALMTGYEVRPAVAVARGHRRARQPPDAPRRRRPVEAVVEERGRARPAEVVDLRETADDAPVIKLVNQIIAQAVEHGASDIHLEPDGTRAARALPHRRRAARRRRRCRSAMVAGVISRVKIMADLDIAERRLPQDGRVGLTIDGHHVDLRVVTLPSVHGESVVMRILDKDSVRHRPRQARHGRARARPLRARRSTRPTAPSSSPARPARASRRRSTPRSASSTRPRRTSSRSRTRSSTSSTGINQVQVNPKAGLTFATGLRSMLRADPDIIMVGEIRDRETAQIAVEAALTGHLVLSTLHTNDAPTAITRLDRDGHRAVPRRQRDRLRRRPAPRAHAVPRTARQRDDHPGDGAARPRLPDAATTSRPTSPSAARAAAAPATRAASASTR